MAEESKPQNPLFRDRIRELRRVKASELRAHPRNWRLHGEGQKEAMRRILADVGMVDGLICRETEEGLQILNGHLRQELAADEEVPVLVVDLSDEEAERVLLTFDPVSQLAETDEGLLEQLRAAVGEDPLADWEETVEPVDLDSLPEEPADLKPIPIKPRPEITWLLVGIPTVRFGEISAEVERISARPEIIIEMSVSSEAKPSE